MGTWWIEALILFSCDDALSLVGYLSLCKIKKKTTVNYKLLSKGLLGYSVRCITHYA